MALYSSSQANVIVKHTNIKSESLISMQDAEERLTSIQGQMEVNEHRFKESEADITSQLAAFEMSKHVLQNEKQVIWNCCNVLDLDTLLANNNRVCVFVPGKKSSI